MNRIVAFAVLFFVICTKQSNGKSVGEVCQVARSGAQGVCKKFNECTEAVNDLLNSGLQPASCGSFVGRVQVICCAVPVVRTTTTTPAPTRVSMRSKF